MLCATEAAAGRFAAGTDPAKRKQIMEGARCVFMKAGFDGASMNTIARQAGVSKGTIYGYFASKKDLFAVVVDCERDRIANGMRNLFPGSGEVEAELHSFGTRFVRQITSPEVIGAMRIVIGVSHRMPSVSSFFHTSPGDVCHVLDGFIRHHVRLGNLAVDDAELAARQFIEMATGSFFKLCLFGDLDDVPSDAELERAIHGAVRVFMAAYGFPAEG